MVCCDVQTARRERLVGVSGNNVLGGLLIHQHRRPLSRYANNFGDRCISGHAQLDAKCTNNQITYLTEAGGAG